MPNPTANCAQRIPDTYDSFIQANSIPVCQKLCFILSPIRALLKVIRLWGFKGPAAHLGNQTRKAPGRAEARGDSRRPCAPRQLVRSQAQQPYTLKDPKNGPSQQSPTFLMLGSCFWASLFDPSGVWDCRIWSFSNRRPYNLIAKGVSHEEIHCLKIFIQIGRL